MRSERETPCSFWYGPPVSTSILLTGATGFIGRRVLPKLQQAGFAVRCATRDVAAAKKRSPELEWVHLDLGDRATIGAALAGCSAALYLVHAMAEGEGYEARERDSARAFAEESAAQHLERIVYLGGVVPRGAMSHHLHSRMITGEILRGGTVPVFELRATMVVGHGSISWKIVRDLAVRLPAMILPRWMSSRSQPIAIDDVTFALVRALTLPLEHAGVHDLPGPEILTAKEILLRIAHLRGTRPLMISVPFLTPRLSSYWLKLVTGADYRVARELVDGLASDLVATQPELWRLVEHTRLSFDEAARLALADEG